MAGGGDPQPHFKKGSAVEISSNDDGFRGAWYEGTIIRPATSSNSKKKKQLVLVEYKTLTSNKDLKSLLRETVDPLQIRPVPPPDHRKRRRFDFSQEVDAWYSDGWWEGVVTEVLVEKDDVRYAVFFRGTREQIVFRSAELRTHREWIGGSWVPPLQEDGEDDDQKLVCPEVSKINEINQQKAPAEVVFGEEMLVEVSSDEDGFQGAWFAATIIKKIRDHRYLIEYKSLRNDDDTDFLREEADAIYIRPYPPDTIMVDRFNLHEEIDALYNDGWWVGVISKVLNDGRYVVYFRSTDEEMKFSHSELRVHHEWINGTWVVSSRALKSQFPNAREPLP